MSLSLEAVLGHTGARVAVLDRDRRVIYSNRDGENVWLQTTPVAEAVERSLAGKCGFAPVAAKAGEEGGDLLVSGEYSDAEGGMLVLTATDVTAINRTLEKAEREAVSKSSYLANMSHEIRTPVNAIAGFSRLLAQTDDKTKQARYAEVIETNTRLLMQLIDDVLDLAKMEQGHLEFRSEEVDLNEFIRSMESTVRLRVQPGTILNYVMGAADCRIVTDRERLSQVMLNLLTNACKFTPHGSITFGYELRADSVYFFVKDTGAGISPDRQKLLFRRFSKQNDAVQGTGLGLSICKDIVETFKGEIGVESAGEGRGSLFWFTIPVSPVENAATEAAQSAAPAAGSGADNRPLILVAEDNESNYFLFSSILEDDYRLVHAWNGREAVELFPETQPDLILMDINMPYMDGYEATRRIRQQSATVPVIAVTAYAFSSDKTRIMENGFNSYISKPVDADRLVAEMRRLLRN